jgi:capsular polysaccharide biosynthesis protein
MQLRYFLSLLRRFWALVLVLPLLVGGFSGFLELRRPVPYVATAQVMVTQKPYVHTQESSFPDFNLISSWQSSEFIVDDMPQVVRSLTLAQDVSDWLASQGMDVAPTTVQAGLGAQTFHRSVTISSQAATPELATQMLAGTIASLQAHGLKYWNRAPSDDDGLSVAVLNPATQAAPARTTRQMLLHVALRVALALAAGVGLAFLLHYLDDRLRDEYQVAALLDGIEVIGVIPEERV